MLIDTSGVCVCPAIDARRVTCLRHCGIIDTNQLCIHTALHKVCEADSQHIPVNYLQALDKSKD